MEKWGMGNGTGTGNRNGNGKWELEQEIIQESCRGRDEMIWLVEILFKKHLQE